ncbi:MAG: hypothetical protein OQL08_09010 [Gammaproteobacteria bacterium]|nr:hypothetical protein [Gammaproteobacteria bacterium]
MSLTQEIEDEVLVALEGADKPMGRADIFAECALAGDVGQISTALNRLLKRGLVEKMTLGLWAFVPDGVPEKEPAAAPRPTTIRAAIREIPRLGSGAPAKATSEDPLIAAVRSLPVPEPFPDATRSAAILQELANWPAMHPEVAEKLSEIAAEITRRAA